MTSWEQWRDGVLSRLSAPLDAINSDTAWAWSNAETAPYDLMRWNNPLNSTEKWFNSRDSGAQPGPRDVQIYRSLQDGIDATVVTLLNGNYPVIVDYFRRSVPRQQWAGACANLKTWGTGCGWIADVYGAAPGVILATTDMPEYFQHSAVAIAAGAKPYYSVGESGKRAMSQAEAAAVSAAHPGIVFQIADAALDQIPDVPVEAPEASGGAVDLTATNNAIAALAATLAVVAGDVATVKMRIEKDLAP